MLDDDANPEQLFRRMQQGDAAALHALYEANYAALLRFAYHIAGSRDAAEDAVQSVFVSMWASRDRLVLKGSVGGYLFRAVRNSVLKSLDHDRVARSAEALIDYSHPHGMGQPAAHAAAELEAADDVRLAMQLIQQLPERQRTAMLLRWNDGLTTSQIADVMEISRQGVEKLLGQALSKLRGRLTP